MSLEAERAVLGCLMVYGSQAAEVLNKLDNDCFYYGSNKQIFIAIDYLMNNGKPCDAIYINKHDSDLEMWLLVETAEFSGTIKEALSYCEALTDDSTKRKLSALAYSINEQLVNTAPADVINFIQQQAIALTESKGTGIVPINVSMKSYIEHVKNRFESGTMSGLSSGYSKFDDAGNGFQQEEIYVLSGTPGSGKTTLAMKFAMEVAKTKPVYFLSMEMGERQLAQRMTSSLGMVHMSKLTSGKLGAEDWTGMTNGVLKAKQLNDNLMIDYSPSASTSYIRMKANEIKMKHGDLGLIVVDYFGLLDQPKGSTFYESSIQNAIALNRMKKELGCSILVLAQLNKDTLKSGKRPGQGDLDWGGQLSKDADGIFFLYRNDQMKEDGVVQFYSDKTRSMEAFNFFFDNNLAFNRLEQREHEYREPESNNKGFGY